MMVYFQAINYLLLPLNLNDCSDTHRQLEHLYPRPEQFISLSKCELPSYTRREGLMNPGPSR